ncbi:MAG: hypothetical protein ACOZAG_01670 [Patescibacteria group bacterium]
MDRRFTDLTRDTRIRLRDFLKARAEANEEVVAMKEVPCGRFVRVAREEGGLVIVFVVSMVATKENEVVAHSLRDGDLAFSLDFPCLVRI